MTIDVILLCLAALCCYIGDKENQKGWFYLAGFLVAIIVGMTLATVE